MSDSKWYRDSMGLTVAGGIVFVVIPVLTALITFFTVLILSSDSQSFTPLPGNKDCVVVDWQINTLAGTDENRSGVFCRTDIEK